MRKVDEVLQKYMVAAGIIVEMKPEESEALNSTAAAIDANADNDPNNDRQLTPDEKKTKVLLGKKKRLDQVKADTHKKNISAANTQLQKVVASSQPKGY